MVFRFAEFVLFDLNSAVPYGVNVRPDGIALPFVAAEAASPGTERSLANGGTHLGCDLRACGGVLEGR